MTPFLAAVTAAVDPDFSPAGWVITASYAVAGALCLAAARRDGGKRATFGWLLLGAALLAMSLNKQLDLQSILTSNARTWARDVGLYGYRRALQAVFVILLVSAALAATFVVTYRSGRRLLRYPFACCGVLLLIGFVLLRAASFHHMAPIVSAALPLVLELSAAALVVFEAIRVLKRESSTGGCAASP